MGHFFLLVFVMVNFFIKLSNNKPVISNNLITFSDNQKPKFKMKGQGFSFYLPLELRSKDNFVGDSKRKDNVSLGKMAKYVSPKVGERATTTSLMEIRDGNDIDNRDKAGFISFNGVVTSHGSEGANHLNIESGQTVTVRTNNKSSDWHPLDEKYSKEIEDGRKFFPESGNEKFKENTSDDCTEDMFSPNHLESIGNFTLPEILKTKENLTETRSELRNFAEMCLDVLNCSVVTETTAKPITSKFDATPAQPGSKNANESEKANNGHVHKDAILVVRVGSGHHGFNQPKNKRISDPAYLECPEKCQIRDLNGDCHPDLHCWMMQVL